MSGDPIAEQMHEWRELFQNRRTVPWQMFDAAERLIRASHTHHARHLEAHRLATVQALDELKAAHVAEIGRLQDALERERRLRVAAETSEREYRQRQTNLREQRETTDDGTLVRIAQPKFKSYGDREMARPWTLEELGVIEQRFRLAGGTDDTEVRFKHEHVEATVPFPELALEWPSRPPATPEGSDPRSGTLMARPDDPAKARLVVYSLVSVLLCAALIWSLVW